MSLVQLMDNDDESSHVPAAYAAIPKISSINLICSILDPWDSGTCSFLIMCIVSYPDRLMGCPEAFKSKPMPDEAFYPHNYIQLYY